MPAPAKKPAATAAKNRVKGTAKPADTKPTTTSAALKKTADTKPVAKSAAPAPKATAPAPAPATTSAPKSNSASVPKSALNPAERLKMVAETAYYLAQKRGFTGGDELSDWVAAEKQVDSFIAKRG